MYNILLVDDEPIIKMAFRKMINWGETDFAIQGMTSNGLEALDFIKNNPIPIDIIVTDLVMPQMDGIELIRQVKETGFDGEILVLSNYSDFELVRQALLAGAMDYMLKVNINAQLLTQQLEKARQRIAANRNEQETLDKQNRENNHKYAIAHSIALKDYITNPHAASLPDILQDEYAKGGFWLILVLISQAASGRTPNPEHSIDILCSVFEEAQIDALVLSPWELLLIVPHAPLLEKKRDIYEKSANAHRQLKLYLGLQSTCIIPPVCASLQTAQKAYPEMLAAKDYLFYEPDAVLLRPEEIQFACLESSPNAANAAQELFTLTLTKQQDTWHKHLLNLLDSCRQSHMHPTAVRQFFVSVMAKFAGCAGIDIAKPEWLEFTEKISFANTISELLHILDSCCLYVWQNALPPEAAAYKKDVQNVILYLQAHYMEKITLAEIAKAVNLNPSYLCRLFKRDTGENLFQYLNNLRIKTAAALLLTDDMYIKEAASCVGIEDAFYFARLFKRAYGVSPSEYRCSVEAAAQQ